MSLKQISLSLVLLVSLNSSAQEFEFGEHDIYASSSAHTYIGYLSSIYSTHLGSCGGFFYSSEQQPTSAFKVSWNCNTKGGGKMFQQAMSAYDSKRRVIIGVSADSKALESISM